jgi:hypothetical protein
MQALANLKSSGHYARIIAEVRDEIEREHEALPAGPRARLELLRAIHAGGIIRGYNNPFLAIARPSAVMPRPEVPHGEGAPSCLAARAGARWPCRRPAGPMAFGEGVGGKPAAPGDSFAGCRFRACRHSASPLASGLRAHTD